MAAADIIGRRAELREIREFMDSGRPEFVVVYGRRRVGKTYLVREAFEHRFAFQLTGLANASLPQQLLNFHTALQKAFPHREYPVPESWFEAFQQLMACMEKKKKKRQVIFLDELPWLDTPRSSFISALEHFWNSWASARKDIVLIVCGSAASWMLNKLINNRGGLHNRVTRRMKILPFTLHECEAFLRSRHIHWTRYQLIEIYMALGGIPYYLNALQPGMSPAQNIDRLCFSETGLLRQEFDNLYASLFRFPENHTAVSEALSRKARGLSREELIAASGLPNGGGATKVLEELEASGFIRRYLPFDKKVKDSLYQLSDFYTLFYYRFIHKRRQFAAGHWLQQTDSPGHRAWSGYAFEQVCLAHVPQIKKELGISGVHSEEASWRSSGKDNGAQVDLLIDRRDQVINLCEMKFSINPFTIDKRYAAELRNKIGVFRNETQTRKAVFLTMISTYGVKANEHSAGLVQNNLDMDCLFAP
ncbi:MAG: AAA family ATPase [Bacteroidia bacterium]|nr:AAA family ATPase [Bacteroidia bacterium]